MTQKNDVFLKFVVLQQLFKEGKFYPKLPTNKQEFFLILNKFKKINDIVEDKNEN